MAFGDRFLNTPALFPARFAGDPHGTGTVTVSVAGGPYHFGGLSPRQESALRSRYGARCVDDEAAAVDITLFAVDAGEFRRFDRIGVVNDYDFDYGETTVAVAGYRVMARISWEPLLRAAFWTSEEDGPVFLELVENCFRPIVAYQLLDRGGAALHSSAVVSGGRAWVFYGHSGAGKTTLARRSRDAGRQVLSDDLNAVYLHQGRPWVAKLPFAGELGDDGRAGGPYPLAALSRIEKAPEESWNALSPAAAVASLTASAPFLNADEHRLPRLLANLDALASGCASGVLRLGLEGDPWEVLEAVAR